MSELKQATPTFESIVPEINNRYITFINALIEKFKYHEFLGNHLVSAQKDFKDDLEDNDLFFVDTLTENFLYCLEEIVDNNSDYFSYEKEKTKNKKGKTIKHKVAKIIGKVSLKKLLDECPKSFYPTVFNFIKDLFTLLTVRDENNSMVFIEEYASYVKDNYTDDKHYSKMMLVIDNLDVILNQESTSAIGVEESESASESDNETGGKKHSKKDKKSAKKKKNKKASGSPLDFLNEDFLKSIESTKIASLAKDISSKINPEDFNFLSNPMELLSSLMNPGASEGEGGEGAKNGLQDLMKLVTSQVEESMKNNNIDQSDLMNEATDLFSKLQEGGGLDPMALLASLGANKEGGGEMPDLSMLANLASMFGGAGSKK